jgi:hypothetical protein
MDMAITARETQHAGGVVNHLMQLSTAAVGYIEKKLYDFYNIQIYSNIYFGSNKQEFPLIFDTGSAWVWVGTDLCDTCANEAKFDVEQSNTFKQNSNKLSSLYYGRGMVTGYDTQDTVCLT